MTGTFVPTPSPFTLATFAPLVGQAFVTTHDGARVTLELFDAHPLPLHPADGRALGRSGFVRRDPFTLWFRGPVEQPLPQGLHAFENGALGILELHVVPTGPGETGLTYEALFN